MEHGYMKEALIKYALSQGPIQLWKVSKGHKAVGVSSVNIR